MKREWKPGDVAMVKTDLYGEMVAFRCGTASNPGWQYATADGRASSWSADSSGYVKPIRPFVVIDPEDREQVERLVESWYAASDPTRGRTSQMQAALRELANPQPPKPDEPQGLGAVVEDADGERWVRWSLGEWPDRAPWRADGPKPDHRRYDCVSAVRILSPGVEDGAR